jgi:hypothetical protein
MRLLKIVIFAIFIFSCIVETDARGRWRRRRARTYSTSYVGGAPAEYYNCSDQRKCELEAQHMHTHGIRAHIWQNIGNFEGWGYGGPGCATCVPRGGMVLTGDAHYGSIRVRSWR